MSAIVRLWVGSAGSRIRIRRALPSTLLVHATTSLCTASLALPLAASVPAQGLAEQRSVGALFTALRLFDSLTTSPLSFGGVPALVLLLVAPLLQVLWLRAQLKVAPIHEHARGAARRYKHACAVYLGSAAYAAVLLGVAALVSRLVEALLGFSHNVRLQETSGLLASAPLVLAALLHAPSVCDQAQLALARGAPLSRALVLGATRSADLKVCAIRGAFGLVTAGLVLMSVTPRLWLGTSPEAAVWLFLLAQLTAVGRTAVRAAWLAWLVERSSLSGHLDLDAEGLAQPEVGLRDAE